jgi:hypothetical protein
VLGSLITFIQVFGAAPWVPIVSGSFGAIIAIAAGWQRIAAIVRPGYRIGPPQNG